MSSSGGIDPTLSAKTQWLVEIKAVVQTSPVFAKQMLTYLKVTGLHVGLLINFHVASMASPGAIRRFVL
jgi:GxxExxY protein